MLTEAEKLAAKSATLTDERAAQDWEFRVPGKTLK